MRRLVAAVAVVSSLGAGLGLTRQGGISSVDRDFYKRMLADARKDIEKNYYDAGFRGLDLESTFQDASTKLLAAGSSAEAIDVITATVLLLDDSHTRFYPPPRATRVDYGWSMAAVGEDALVIQVNPASDAASRGLAAGDRVLALNRFRPTRANLWQIQHYYRVVRPQALQRIQVRKPDGSERTLDVKSKVEQRRVVQILDAILEAFDEAQAEADTSATVEPGVLVWRMRSFGDSDDLGPFVARARKAGALVLDLRGNAGGDLECLKTITGLLFEREVPLMTMVGRKGETREVAKPKRNPFLGKLVVLIDSRSASASELLARTVQLQKRGSVVGDRSAGAVMASQFFSHSFGVGNVAYYATSVTIADVLMPDGGRLERTGVKPDETVLPSTADLAAGRDPALARAVALAGGSITPEQAGQLTFHK